jgi:hypothetical protein
MLGIRITSNRDRREIKASETNELITCQEVNGECTRVGRLLRRDRLDLAYYSRDTRIAAAALIFCAHAYELLESGRQWRGKSDHKK